MNTTKTINKTLLASPSKLLLVLAVAVVWGLWQPATLQAAGFNAGRIIDDAVFTHYNSMSPSQIQSFLDSKVACDTWGTEPSEYGGGTRAQYSQSQGVSPPFKCLESYSQNGKSAAQIIYDTAQEFKISPKVLIVLLQKEQGLVTDEWPWPVQYRTATGYACPDSAPCDSEYYGFTNQVRWAARMFRAIMNNSSSWYTPYVLGNNQIYWHPDLNRCGSSTVNIQNRSTVALYSYTPYRPNQAALNAGYGTGDSCSSYGNRNFYLYFRDWFGSLYTTTPYAWEKQDVNAYTNNGMTQEFSGQTINLTPGGKAYIRVSAHNMGNQTWQQSVVHLGTANPNDRTSKFKDASWLSSVRPAQLTQTSVPPGSDGTFIFSITAPSTPGTYKENFNLVAEGRTWLNNQNLSLNINVSVPAAPANTDNTLSSGEQLTPGEHLLSPSLHDVVILQNDGNAVLYTNFGARWSTKTATKPARRLAMQTDGNLVLYGDNNSVLWHAGTGGNPGARFVAQTDSNLVIYSSTNQPLWSSSTMYRPDGLNYVNQSLYLSTLYEGQRLETPDRNHRMQLQTDGNLVLYSGSHAVWASGTAGKNAHHLTLQSDGNLVLYGDNGAPLWYTRTAGRNSGKLTVQSDGNLVLYSKANQPVWHTATYGR